MKSLHHWVTTHGKLMHFAKGMMVIQQDELATHLYLLNSGWIKIGQEIESGATITLSLRKEGDLFGLAEVLAQNHVRSRSAYCLTNVSLYAISAKQLQTLLKEEPDLWQYLCRIMAERLLETQHFVRALTTLPAPQRLGWFLQQFAVQRGDVYTVALPLTHEEISYLVGCSRQKVTSYLNAWRNEGAVMYERGRIDILNSAILFPEL
ncbi:MAG: Crp/Fnr family transcriptional regulator [Solibacillus sp.]